MKVRRPWITRIGRRGAFLLFLALLDAAYGYSLLAVPLVARRGLGPLLLPAPVWAAIWLAAAAACAVSAFRSSDRAAFTFAAAVKTAWSALAFHGWVTSGAPLGWLSGVIWAAFAVTVLIISSWPEPPPGTHL